MQRRLLKTRQKWALMTEKLPQFDIAAQHPFSRNKHISIRASAGTGKTYSLTTVVARMVAEEDLRADQLLLMTFTNEATAELRQETRKRCQEALKSLQGLAEPAPWMQHMNSSDETRNKAISSLQQFLSRYDEVTISTIHGFCQSVLRQAGLSGNAPANFEVVKSIDDIIDQTITDLLATKLAENPAYLYQFHEYSAKDSGTFSAKNVASSVRNLREAVRTMLNNPGALELPAEISSKFATTQSLNLKDEKTQLAQRIANEARAVVKEIEKRCKTAGIITYNDMIRLVAHALESDTAGQTLALQLAQQYPVIMVDEFQDTDAMQWAIFHRIFVASNGSTSLLTVGDPKQAIYRFRGADVNVYLSALKKSEEEYDLGVNRRSDKPLLDALEVLLEKETFDVNGDVTFTKVEADSRRLTYALGASSESTTSNDVPGAPLEIRYLPDREELGGGPDGKYGNSTAAVEQIIYTDLTSRVIELLNGCVISDRKDNEETQRPLLPSDIAILVFSHRVAEEITQRLRDASVPAVRLKTGTVFSTDAAQHWWMLLRALANPSRPTMVRSYGLSWFGGCTEQELSEADIDKVIALQRTCAERANIMHNDGVTAMYMAYRNHPDFLAAVLSDVDGQRNLTDLDHIAEILSSLSSFSTSAGPLECLEALEDLILGADEDSDEQKRRIETDQDSVKVMTIHASKGLQFPIVFLPNLRSSRNNKGPLMFPAQLETGADHRRVIDVASQYEKAKAWEFVPNGLDGPDVSKMKKTGGKLGRKSLADEDLDSDSRRLFYVAMTRAQHKIVGYWAPTNKKPKDPFIRAVTHATGLTEAPISANDLHNAFLQLHAASGGNFAAIEMELVPDQIPLQTRTTLNTSTVDGISVATFSRPPDSVALYGFGRWSYTSVTKRLKGQGLIHKRELEASPTPGVADESNTEEDTTTTTTSPHWWHGLPAGASFGNSIHHVLDIIDPSASDLAQEIRTAIDDTFLSWGSELDRDHLTHVLLTILTTTLHRDFGGTTLATLGRQNRLSEMNFDFPLPANSAIAIDHIVQLAIQHGNLSPSIKDSFEQLGKAVSDTTTIAGYMNGSIDAVFRISDTSDRFIVCDYKSNKLHADSDLQPMLRYDQQSMEQAMLKDGYFFQAMIYSVALHRYLKLRLTNYDFDTHFGGVAYLFLRGLNGDIATDGGQYGYYSWNPSRQLVEALDELFTEERV